MPWLDSCSSLLYTDEYYNTSSPELLTCMSAAFLNTKTPFYDYPDFTLPRYYGILCFSYSLGGLILLYMPKPRFMKNEKCFSYLFPYYTYAYLVILQGFLSYQADYINMDKDSLYHVYDRTLANPLMLLQFIKTILNIRYSKQHVLLSLFEITSFFTAGTLFYQSQVAQSKINRDEFIFWHCLWHCYPLILIVTTLIGRKMELAREMEFVKEKHHPLLSDKVLEKIDYELEKKIH